MPTIPQMQKMEKTVEQAREQPREKFCPTHGHQISGLFCSRCGAKLQTRPLPVCSHCMEPVYYSAIYCHHCGVKRELDKG